MAYYKVLNLSQVRKTTKFEMGIFFKYKSVVLPSELTCSVGGMFGELRLLVKSIIGLQAVTVPRII
jgi:hypothetical protein